MSISLFGQYLKEREGVDLIETEHGFIIYSINKQECYVRDVYIHPEFRKKRSAFELVNLAVFEAKKAGCTILTGTVCPSANGSTESLDFVRAYQMKLHSSINNLIYFTKDI